MNVAKIEQKLRELAALKHNWDSYGALPISPACLNLVRRTLAASECPEPVIVPGRGGGVQLEWQLNGCDVELEFRQEEIALLVAPGRGLAGSSHTVGGSKA